MSENRQASRRQTPAPRRSAASVQQRASAPQRKPTPRYNPTPRYTSTPRRSQRPQQKRGGNFPSGNAVKVAGGIVAAIAVVALCAFVVAPGIGSLFAHDEQEGAAPAAVVSFVAVGDNLPDDHIGWYADSLAGEVGDGKFDYAPIFGPIASYIEGADLAYIDEETHLGGDDIGPQGYPSFNATDAMAAAVVDTGFDLVASATNHSFDWGEGALAHSVALWESQPVAFTGTAVTEEQYNRIPVVERGGITFALLNYTYGVNAFTPETLPPYAVNFIDEARIRSDVARAHDMADVVLVSMHWGTELLTEADEDQVRWAQLLADLDVDVVLGSHPHVIGPMAWVANSANPDHRTLVTYSLGNFLADHESPLADNVLEGMLTCDFVRAEADGPVSVENIRWIPLVCHSSADRSDFAVYTVDDYTEEQARQCRALSEIADPITWLLDETHRIVGAEWF